MKVLNHDLDALTAQKANITATEIENQPKIWRKLQKLLAQNRSEYAAFMDTVLSVPNLRIIFTGAGSSAFIGESMSLLLMQELGIRSEVHHTTEVVATPGSIFYDVPTLLVSYSRSGSSPESVAAIQMAQKYVTNLYNLVLVCNADSVLSEYGHATANSLVIPIPQEASDQGFAMTCSVSCMALATWVLFSGIEMEARTEYLGRIADSVEEQFDELQKRAWEAAQWDYRRIVYLGFGALRGLAREGAVKSQELTNGFVSATYDTPTGFRHGPKTILNDETLTVLMASPLELASLYDADMVHELATQKVGNRLLVTIPEQLTYSLEAVDHVVRYRLPADPMGKEINSYMMSLMFLQLLSMEKSLALGITTDNPCPNGEVNRVVQGVTVH